MDKNQIFYIYGKPLWTKIKFLYIYTKMISYFVCRALNFTFQFFDWHCTYSPTLTSSFVIWPLNLQFYSPIMSAIFHLNFELHFYSPILSCNCRVQF